MAVQLVTSANDIHRRMAFFPTNWRTIPEDRHDFYCQRAYYYLPEGHPVIEIFRLSLLSLIRIQKEIRQSGENLPAATMQHLEGVQRMLDSQLGIMQNGILQRLATAESDSESESESETEP